MKIMCWLRIVILLFCLIISSVSSLKCYQCDEQTDSDCRHSVQPSMIKECPKKPYGPDRTMINATGCTVLLSRTNEDPTSPKNTERMCFYSDVIENTNLLQKDGCRSVMETIYQPYKCKACLGDLCNSSKSHSANIMILLLASLFIYISIN